MTAGDMPAWLPGSASEHAVVHASKPECDADREARAGVLDGRRVRALAAIRDAGAAGIAGYCPLCDARHFMSKDHAAGEPDLREGLACDGCRTNARVRAGLVLLRALCPERSSRIYLTEQVSTAYLWLCRHYPEATGSEYAPNWLRRARLALHLLGMSGRWRVRFEDVTGLTLATASQDAVVSFDVLEHVYDFRAALREFARITQAGGWLVLTVPFTGAESTLERARVHPGGRIEHIHPPEYHGNPLGDGALCFRHFGWDLLDDLRMAGYRHAAVVNPWWPEAGLFDGPVVIVAQR